MENKLKVILPHVISIFIIFLVNLIYFFPQLNGKVVQQSDIISSTQANKAIRDYNQQFDKTYLWNPAQFSGMPMLTNAPSTSNALWKVYTVMKLGFKEPMGLYFVGCVLAYFMFVFLGFSPWMSLIFSFPVILTTSNLILWEAGHNSKIRTLIFTPLLIGGVLSIFEYRKYWLGFLLLAVGFSFSFYTRHPQMTYYVLLVFLVYGIIVLYDTVRSKDWGHFGKGTALVVLATLLGLCTSASKVWSLYDYSSSTMRGEAILKTENENQAKSSSEVDGLEWNYAMNWSNGVGDLMATFIPGFQGGGSRQEVSTSSATYKAYRTNIAPLYWGVLPPTVGPMYQGASILFLFVLGLFIVKGKLKWWLGIGAIWMAILSMGINASFINRIVFDYFPFYSSFRAPQSVLSVASFFLVILSAKALQEIISTKVPTAKSKRRKKHLRHKKSLLFAYGICGGLALIFALIGTSIFDFTAATDAQYIQQGADVTPFVSDRKSLFVSDSWRSFLIVSAIGALIYFYHRGKLKPNYVIIGTGLIVLFDLMGVSTRYLSHDNFVNGQVMSQNFRERPVDTQIKNSEQDRSLYRVHDLTINTWNSSEASVFHNTIGGYSPAKMQRYQDLIDNHITQSNIRVLDMLNTKYFITNSESGQPRVQQNPGAIGPAWFVSNIVSVSTPREEIGSLNAFDPKEQAIVLSSEFPGYIDGLLEGRDSSATITLSSYEPDELVYQSSSNREMLAVFSEIWYGPNKGWRAYLDGNPVEHIRANYALRALRVPPGNHEITFSFRPQSFYLGETISLGSSVLLILLVLGTFFKDRIGLLDRRKDS